MPIQLRNAGKPPDLLTVSGAVHFQGVGYKPISVPMRYDRRLEGSEQPYQRGPIPSPTQWDRLQLGWIDRAGLVIIQNHPSATTDLLVASTSGNPEASTPTGLVLRIRPGESLPFDPEESYCPLSSLVVKGDGSLMTVTAFAE